MANSTIGVRLDENDQATTLSVGKARDRSPHYLMKAAVQRYSDAEEALESEREIVEARWKNYELTGETLDHDQVKTWATSVRSSE